MRTFIRVIVAASAVVAPCESSAQETSIARRVDAVREGVISMRFSARPGVCGDSDGSTWTRTRANGSLDSREICIGRSVRVRLGRSNNHTETVRISVGDARRDGVADADLGVVSAAGAARYLMQIAHEVGGRNSSEAISGAALADSVNLAPELQQFVRDANASVDARQQALYWLGQTPIPTTELANLYTSLRPAALRENFVYVISQRRDDAGVTKLIDIASHDPDHDVRKNAMYWLGQTRDPRALGFLRDLITR
jgi:hypothetical protein